MSFPMPAADEFFSELLEAVNPKKSNEIEAAFFDVVGRWAGCNLYVPKTQYQYEMRQQKIRDAYNHMIKKASEEYGLCPAEVVKIIRGRPKKQQS